MSYHHEKVINAYKAKMQWWTAQCSKNRCLKCWLRCHDCYCNTLTHIRNQYESIAGLKEKIKVSIFYHFKEIGRGPNTAHIFPALFPEISQEIVFGDDASEDNLITDIHYSLEDTCILYPSQDAISLDDWMEQRQISRKVHLILLDGTYPCASRLVRVMKNRALSRGINLPLVKLNLENGACKSAIAGVMYQPSKEKLCSLQALTRAIKELKLDDSLEVILPEVLFDWMAHILSRKIKSGKSKPRLSSIEVDHNMTENLKAIVVA